MAAGRGTAARAAAGATLETCLADVRDGAPRPVYLLDGDAFLALRAARELAAALVPEAQRALNLVELDAGRLAGRGRRGALHGRASSAAARSCSSRSPRSSPRRRTRRRRSSARGTSGRRARSATRRGGSSPSPRKAGWSAKDLAPGAAIDHDALARDLGLPASAYDAAFVEAAARFAAERELKVAKDDSSALDAALEQGLRARARARRRRRQGRRTPAAREEARRRGPPRDDRSSRRRARGTRSGSSSARCSSRSSPGPASAWTARARRASPRSSARTRARSPRRSRSSPPTSATGRSSARRTWTRSSRASRRIRSSRSATRSRPATSRRRWACSTGPSRTARARSCCSARSRARVRRLIVERERARRAAGERRIGSLRRVAGASCSPLVPEEELGGKKPYGFWMKYQAATRFSRGGAARRASPALAEADVAMKSGQDGRIASSASSSACSPADTSKGADP